MTGPWHYSGDLTNDPAALIRYLIGDTTETRHSPSDTELEYWIGLNTTEGEVDAYAAAAGVAKHLARRFRRLSATTTVKIGDMSLTSDYAKLADQYDDIVADLEANQGPTTGGGPLFDNTRAGAFSMGLMDNA